MHTIDELAQALPITIRRPTAALTPKGRAVLALIHEQDALPADDHTGRARLDVLIAALIEAPTPI